MTVTEHNGAGPTTSGASTRCPSRPSGCQQNLLASGGFNSSAAFQQVKQTQASLARLARVQQQLQCQTTATTSANSTLQQHNSSQSSNKTEASTQPAPSQAAKATTSFVDCLIRRFKDCFSEDFCTVPMFVVGNLSPGSDGTHLILPPCVSLGRQNMSRFASPKNLRHMNSIRDSCKSIEELDLGGNKLTDLIEVYKILQCTPNLKFLNLSENDLSRTAPVAMALTTCSSAAIPPLGSAGGHFGSSSSSSSSASASSPANGAGSGLAASSWTIGGQRTCLAPINQNQQTNSMATRRHSTLGQTTAHGNSGAAAANPGPLSGAARVRPGASRVAEARRLAAANALAQSKKTSSSVATKLANSAANPTGGSRIGATTGGRDGAHNAGCKLACVRTSASQRHLAKTSTMHLARSLSSLSAKDVRAATRANEPVCSRLQRHQQPQQQPQQPQQPRRIPASKSTPRFPSSSSSSSSASSPSRTGASKSAQLSRPLSSSQTTGKLFTAEPIAESDADVDMTAGGELPQQQQTNSSPPPTRAPAGPQAPAFNYTRSPASPPAIQSATSNYAAGASSSFGSSNGNNSNNAPLRRTFESIKALALNNTGCQWRVVCSILSRMPNLEELHLSLNNYERIDLEPQEFKHSSIKRLYLCNNPKLTNWEELNKLLIAFPSLEALSIADCNISQIPDNLANSREWKKICGLNINGWPIKEWPVIERLNQLPSLVDLKCRNLEILSTIDEPRHHLIARLPKLQRLNGSEIEEREHAEKAFLRFFMANSHLERPERFHELLQIHGEVAPVDVDVDLSPPSQAQIRVIFLNRNYYTKENEDDILMSEDFLVKLMDNIDPNAAGGASGRENTTMDTEQDQSLQVAEDLKHQPIRLFKDEGQEVVAIEVDLRQSVRKFKSTLANLFGLSSPQNLILYYIDHEMVGLMGPELIKHNQKKLWNYNVQDGDQFIVEER